MVDNSIEVAACAVKPRCACAGRQQPITRSEPARTRLVAVGRTNQEIGRNLFLSTRTVDMHVRNVLAKLGCRSRVEATHRAGRLGLLDPL
jgi:DNA-binding CsgD family transcriptional regulator